VRPYTIHHPVFVGPPLAGVPLRFRFRTRCARKVRPYTAPLHPAFGIVVGAPYGHPPLPTLR
jgi:hypothetical protein